MDDQLDGILGKLSQDEFLRKYCHQNFLRIVGEGGRFGDLLPWPAINDILRHHSLQSPRLRLFRDGKKVPEDSYSVPQVSAHGSVGQRLLAVPMTAQLREGATLIIDRIDEIHEPITRLAEGLERQLGLRVTVNMYASWCATPGFDLHWDDHDVFILQVAGRKQWAIYNPTSNYPLTHGLETDVKPAGAAVWAGIVESGDALYIPRGWWHNAVACDGPSLHLTVGFEPRTGMDILGWLARQLAREERLRRDIPDCTDRRRREEYLSCFLDVVTNAISRPDLLDMFERDSSGSTINRPSFSLPWSAGQSELPASDSQVVSLATSFPMEVRRLPESSMIGVGMNGKVLTFHEAASPLLEYIIGKRTTPVSEVHERFDGQYEPEQVTEFLGELVRNGVLRLSDCSETQFHSARV